MNTIPKPLPLARQTRRRLVLGVYGGYLGVVLFWTLSSQLSPWFFAAALLIGGLTIYCYVTLMLRGGFWWLANAPDLDERQAGARDNAYRLAYAYGSSTVMLMLLYWYIATDAKRLQLWLPATSNELNAVFWGLWLLLTTLPAAVLAWLEPEPLKD